MVILTGFFDYLTGWELSSVVLYAIPIFFVAWHVDRLTGIGFAVICAGTWWLANERGNPYVTWWGYPLAIGSRLVYFIFVAVGAAAIKRDRDASRTRISALERTHELEKEIVRASEHEQKRIGQDLHDGLCQTPAAIGCVVTSLKDDLQASSRPEAAVAAEVEDLLKAAMTETRELARGIFPVHLDDGGLAVALEELVRSAPRVSPSVSFEAHGTLQLQDPQAAMHLYRIAQEALRNAIQHSHAKHVVVKLAQVDHTLYLSVMDDGIGLPDAPSQSGMGLKTMQYRARQVGAQLHIENPSSGGTVVTCSLRTDEKAPPESHLA